MNLYDDLNQSLIRILLKEEGRLVGEFQFPDHLEVFRGHFPGNPILPGIFQIEMVKFCLEKLLALQLRLFQVKRTKFTQTIYPGYLITCDIKWQFNDGRYHSSAIISTDDGTAGKLNLILE